MYQQYFQAIIAELRAAIVSVYGERLVSFAIFGSVARGTMRHDSDIDLLIVAEALPRGRMARMNEFDAVEKQVEETLNQAAKAGIHTSLSPILKTPAEVELGSPLFLDMTEEAAILFDQDDFLHQYLADLQQRLERQGAKRIRSGGGYYWVVKPDIKPGEEIPL